MMERIINIIFALLAVMCIVYIIGGAFE